VERFSEDLLPHVKPIDFAVEDPENAREHPEENLDEIRQSLEKHGQVEPLVYWTDPAGKHIIKAGNGRLRVARELGWTRLAMIEFSGTEQDAMDFALRANRAPELARWNVPKRDAQLASLGVTWRPVEVQWRPSTEPFVSPAVIVPPEASAPKPRTDERAPKPETPQCRVARGDLWLLGRHRVLCANPDVRALRLLCSGERPALRYTVVPPDMRPRWWSVGYQFDGVWPGWAPLRQALNGELERAGWSLDDVIRLTRDSDAARWFQDRGDWEPIPQEAYEALSAEGQEKGAFAHPYEALAAVVDKLQAEQDEDVAFLEPLLREVPSALVLGSVLPAALVAAECAVGRCLGALADPVACDRAIAFFEQQTGLTAEKG
jgi:hypothetical protein